MIDININKQNEINNSLMLKLFYIMIFSSFFGSFLSVPKFQSLFLFRIIFYMLICLFILSFARSKIIRFDVSIKNYYAFLFIWLFLSYISLAWADDIGLFLKYNYFLTKNIILILMTSFFMSDLYRMNKIFKIIFIVLLINIFIGLIEITTGWHLKEIPSYYINTWVTNAPFTFFQNINDAATYFVLYLPLSFATLYKVRRSKFLFALVFIVSALIVLSTSSRLNYLVLSIQLVAYFYFLTDKTKYKMLKRLLLSSLVVIFILFIVTNIYILDGGYINNQIINEMASLKGFFSDEAGSLFIRRRLIVESLNVLYESGLLGVGAGNIEFSMRNTNIAELTGTETLHNWWLELIGNYGIVIFVLFIIFYLKILVNLWKIKNRTKSYPLKIYSFSLFVSLLSFSLSSMSSSSIIQLRYIWILFGLGLAVIKLGKEEHKKGVRNENSSYN